jgi:hypothetical protein
MREGLIVLPHTVAVEHHKNLQDKLIAAFGGFTAVTAKGAWKDPHTKIVHVEPVAQYIIAYEPNADQNLELLKIAEWLPAGKTLRDTDAVIDQHAIDSRRTLCDYTDAEVSLEFYRRLVSKLGDPRVGVNTCHADS